MSDRRVIVVGATADYVDLILRRHPGRVLFLTDAEERAYAAEPPPGDDAEVLADLLRPAEAVRALCDHLARRGVQPSGVTSFDCESLALAVEVSRAVSRPFVSAEAVAACRSKHLCKLLWRQAGLPCPRTALVRDLAEAQRFLGESGGPVVLKPLTGSGSELTFLCGDDASCAQAFETMRARLPGHDDARMYAPQPAPGGGLLDPRRVFVIEEFVQGPEFSCDFALDRGEATILRVAAKIPARGLTFGTTLAYVVPGDLPLPLSAQALARQVKAAARAVGIERALGMLDFIARDGRAVMLEMAPRPGGDCLPPLLLRSCGLDVLGAALDFAEGRPVSAPDPAKCRRLVGARFIADRGGVIRRLDDSAVRRDPRVLECALKRGPGDRILVPPEDYDLRILGHAIFDPSPGQDIEAQCRQIAGALKVEMEGAP